MQIYDFEKDVYVSIAKKLTDNETIEFDIPENGYLLKEGCKAIGFPPMTLIKLTAVFQGYSYYNLERNISKRTELNKVFNVYLDYGSDEYRTFPIENGKITLISYNRFKDMVKDNTILDCNEKNE
jgi:hypothetical protein